MSDWLGASREARDKLRSVARGLFHLSDSLHHVGQCRLARRIDQYAHIMSDAEKVLLAAVDEAVNEIAESSRQATANMVQAALAVIQTQAQASETREEET